MNRKNLIRWSRVILLAAGFIVLWRLQRGIDTQRNTLRDERDEVTLRSPQLIKAISLEFGPLLADLYWTRAVQYYGEKRVRGESNFDSLWPLLDITTTLDPNLLIAYRSGSTLLSEPAPRGAGRPDLAVQLIERGIRANPDYWRFYQDLGFVYYIDMKDYAKASQAFLEGSKHPSAQIWMKTMAAKIAAEGDSPSAAAFLWNEVYTSTSDPTVKRMALDHVQLLRAQEDCRQLDEISERYLKQYGKRPATVNDLVRAGLLGGNPVDSLGFPYRFGENGKAELSVASPLRKDQPATLQSQK